MRPASLAARRRSRSREISSLLNEASAARPTGGSGRRPRFGARAARRNPSARAARRHASESSFPTESWAIFPSSCWTRAQAHRSSSGSTSPTYPRGGPVARFLRPLAFLGTALEAPTGLIRRSPDPGWRRRARAMELGGAELSNPLPASAEEARAIAAPAPAAPSCSSGTRISRDTCWRALRPACRCCTLRPIAVADMIARNDRESLFSPDREQDGADYLFLKKSTTST